MINKAFLSLGSNIGMRIDNLNNAINCLDKYSIEVLKKSRQFLKNALNI